MMFSEKYCQAFEEVLKSYKSKDIETPYQTIKNWEDFVEEVIEFYDCIQPEFENDLDVNRGHIDKLLVESKLFDFPEHKLFIEKINFIDNLFKDYTFENPAWSALNTEWYHKRILKKAGEVYANFINVHFEKDYNIKVEIISI